jgi:curved DNA-binding protein
MSGAERMTVEVARRLLAVEANADADTIRAAFKRAVKTAHPDQGGTDEAFRLVLEAHRILDGWQGVEEAQADEARRYAASRLEITLTVAMTGGRSVTKLDDGRKVSVNLPAGLRNGDKVAAAGATLTVVVRGRPEAFISGDDLCMTIKASAALLTAGGRLKVKTPVGVCIVWIPKDLPNPRIVRVLGRGMPARGRHPQGALILKLVPEKGAKDAAGGSKGKRFANNWAAA